MRVLLLSTLWLSLALRAQSNFASLSGNIEDPQHRPVQQARVQVKLIATGFGEGATAANNIAAYINPKASVFPGHSSSQDVHEKQKVSAKT